MFRLTAAVLATVLCTHAMGQEGERPAAATLKIGDAAPTLSKVTWLKGEPVEGWQEGTVYVLDFWATWCGPCVASIPHLNELDKAKGDKVEVIGVAVWPQPGQTPTKTFVDEKGEEMSYRVAEDIDGAMSAAFLEATRSQGIPTAIVVDQKGRVAWIGHPMMGMDRAVDEILAGTYDVEGRAAKAKKQAELEVKAMPILETANRLAGQGVWDEALMKVDEVIAMGYRSAELSLTRAQVMMFELGQVDEGYTYLAAALETHLKDEPEALHETAWFISQAPGLPRRDLDLALRAAKRANEVTGGKDAAMLETLAAVHAKRGEKEAAIAAQEKAVELASGKAKEQLRATLEAYRRGEGIAEKNGETAAPTTP